MGIKAVPAPRERGARVLAPGWWTPALAPGDARPASVPSPGRPVDLLRPLGPPRHAWVDIAERAVRAATIPDAIPADLQWRDALALPVRPFCAAVARDLAAVARACLPPGHADAAAIGDSYARALGTRLARMACPALAAELDWALEAAGAAAGPVANGPVVNGPVVNGTAAEGRRDAAVAGGRGQQVLRAFTARKCNPAGLAETFAQFPVLARLLAITSAAATEAGREVLARLAADRPALVADLLGGRDPGPATAIRPGLGDPHQGGRSVMAVCFADGRQVIYKPRDQGPHAMFSEVLGWLNQRVAGAGLRAPAVVRRPGYGWAEHVASAPLPGGDVAGAYYRRAGILLAALYATHATDIHCENIIASGDVPVIVDAETIFHPALPQPRTTSDDPAARALSESVQRAALLPHATVDGAGASDRSGLSGDPAPGRPGGNRPWHDGAPVDVSGHEGALAEGFRAGYDAIAADRAAFGALVAQAADLEARAVARPTAAYAQLAEGALHPALLRDAAGRDDALGVLHAVSAGHHLWEALAGHELADLRDGDIPLLTARPASADLRTSAGQRLAGVLDKPGLRCALDKVAAMGEVDRGRQEWLIAASLATRAPGAGHDRPRPAPGPATMTAAEPGRLLAAACGLADQVMAQSVTGAGGSDGRVNWIGLQLVEDAQWMVLPMGAALGDGYLGVALFLAELARLAGITRYADIARRAAGPAGQLLAALDGRPELVAAVGHGTSGLGGIAYGLARLAVLLGDGTLAAEAELATSLAASAVAAAGNGTPPGWAAGTAGCLAAMAAVHAETGSEQAANVARRCADQLSDLVSAQAGPAGGGRGDAPGQAPSGFADGLAGIGWALARYAAGAGGDRYQAAARRAAGHALAGTPPAPTPGWCRGAAGLLLAQACVPAEAGGIDAAIAAIEARPVLGDLSLCHGELGVAEALTVVASATGSRPAHRARRRRAGIALDAVARHAPYCGTPGGVPTPGLLSGLAGIGYGLLRLGFAEQVPSVLLLEPGASPPHPTRPSR
ncbi:MAG TPA: type 2 lanthipeptide synthetase LanM family protein [Trebonia sp.]|nr:type 2 lanthipeptide synthetase LanM family protein [Trebonia sp.]